MPKLQWDKTGFLECLGVLPETEVGGTYLTYFGYTVVRQGLVLLVTVRPHESVIELRLRREGSVQDLLGFALLVGGTAEYKREKWGDCLLLPACRVVADHCYYMYEGGAESVAQETLLDVEIVVDPDIRITFND